MTKFIEMKLGMESKSLKIPIKYLEILSALQI